MANTKEKGLFRAPFALLERSDKSPLQDRRCGARAEGKLVCTLPSRKEEDAVRGDLGGWVTHIFTESKRDSFEPLLLLVD